MSFDCTKCKYGYHKFGFLCGKGILYITKNNNKEVDCIAFKQGNTSRKKSKKYFNSEYKRISQGVKNYEKK